MQRGVDYSDWLFWPFLLFVFFIPLSQFLSSAVLVVLTLAAIAVPGRIPLAVNVVRKSWDVLLYMLVIVLGVFNSDDRESGLRTLETSLSLLAMPLVVHRMGKFSNERLQRLFLSFTAGLLVVTVICLGYAWVSYSRQGTLDVFFFYKLTDIVQSHPTYLAYYLIAAITFGLYLLHEETVLVSRLWISVAILVLFGMMLLTAGTTAFVSMLFVLAYFLLRFLLEAKTRVRIKGLVVVLIMVVGLFTFNELRYVDPSGYMADDSWERLGLWESALKAHPVSLFGVGSGDYQAVLNDYYATHGMASYAESNLNPHNQFIESYLAHGLLGLACLLIILIRLIRASVRSGNALGTLIFFPFLIYGLTEVFLGRYQGVVFFAMLSQSFGAFFQAMKPSFILKRA
jgi:O-antigen ligase